MDTGSGDVSVLVDSGVKLSTVAGSEVFFADETNVYRYQPKSAQCDEEISGSHRGPLSIEEGTTCITDADIRGPVSVSDGAGLVLADSDLKGPLRIHGAADVSLTESTISGPVDITSVTGAVTLTGNTINGPLSCSGNELDPTRGDNDVRGPAKGQCADLTAG